MCTKKSLIIIIMSWWCMINNMKYCTNYLFLPCYSFSLWFIQSVLKKYGVDGGFGSETEVELVRVMGKKTVDSQQELEQIASKRNLAIRNGQVLPIGIAASTNPLLVIKDENSIKDAITGVEINPFIKF